HVSLPPLRVSQGRRLAGGLLDRRVLGVAQQRQCVALDLVDVDVRRGRLTGAAELDLLRDTRHVDLRQVVVDLLRRRVAGRDRRDVRGGRVVALRRVDRRVRVELGLVVVGELLAGRARRTTRVDQARAADDRTVGVRAAGALRQTLVQRTVAGQEATL